MAQSSPDAAAKALSPAALDEAPCNAMFVEARKETVRMVDINPHFICKLCKGYLRDPHTFKECLHTFCNGCIRGHFVYHPTLTTCPTCNVFLGAKPWTKLLPDPAMQELANKLLPDFSQQEEAEEEAFYTKLGIKRKEPDTPRAEQSDSTKSSRSLGPSPKQMIQFELHPQRSPDLPLILMLRPLKASCMNTQALLKIMHLRKYVAKKLKLERAEEVEILCKGAVVGPEYSLEFIRRTRWSKGSEEGSKMILEYRRQIVAT